MNHRTYQWRQYKWDKKKFIVIPSKMYIRVLQRELWENSASSKELQVARKYSREKWTTQKSNILVYVSGGSNIIGGIVGSRRDAQRLRDDCQRMERCLPHLQCCWWCLMGLQPAPTHSSPNPVFPRNEISATTQTHSSSFLTHIKNLILLPIFVRNCVKPCDRGPLLLHLTPISPAKQIFAMHIY